MPKKARELSATEIRRLTTPGFHTVGGVAGLLMQVTKTGARSWVLRARIGDRRRDMGLGGFPDVTLAQAREKAREAREQIDKGIDPVDARKQARATLIAERGKNITFARAAEKLLASKVREFRNPKHAAQWSATLETYAHPIIGTLPVDQIELAHIVEVLTRDDLWTTRTETANRTRGRIEAVLSWATVSGYRTGDNPARWRGNLDAILPKPSKLKTVRHHRALPITAMHEFMKGLRKREGIAARALEFLVLTAARSGEVRGATWGEIDMDAKTWTVPASRMKARKEHVVPLTDDAVKLLKGLKRIEGNNLLFPAPRGGQLSDMALTAVMRRMDVNAVPHGFRSTFRDWCSEFTSYAHEVAEMALAHTIPNAVERAYRRGDLLAKRAKLMTDWARFLAAPASADVAPIKRARS
jgi:integrase